MKVYTKVVIDLSSTMVISEESYQYSGPTIECKVGGGGGTNTAYPTYMQTEHDRWLSGELPGFGLSHQHGYGWGGGKPVGQLMEEAMNMSPFLPHQLLDVPLMFLGAGNVITDFVSPYSRIKNLALYDVDTKYSAYTQITDPLIADSISQHSAILDDEYATKILPAFEAGMSDINAVMSSAFVIGRGILLDTKQKQVSKFTKDLQLQAFDWASKRVSLNMEMHRLLVTSSTEITRMYAAVKLEADKEFFDLNEKDARWNLSLFQYGTHVMASISGTAVQTQTVPHPSKIAGALSGALSGAAAGNAIPGVGTLAGGLAGALGGVLG